MEGLENLIGTDLASKGYKVRKLFKIVNTTGAKEELEKGTKGLFVNEDVARGVTEMSGKSFFKVKTVIVLTNEVNTYILENEVEFADEKTLLKRLEEHAKNKLTTIEQKLFFQKKIVSEEER